MQPLKDKRTKEQILKLLDHAMEQEERLGEKIKTLESELKDCRKKVEDPRHEITEEALASSKVSFRVDYYRTSEKSPLKGIIEHLPSRQTKSFEEGEGQEPITQFMNRFLYEETGKAKKKKPIQKTVIEQVVVEPMSEVESALFNLPDIEDNISSMPVSLEELPVLSTAEYDALFGGIASSAISEQPSSRETIQTTAASTPQQTSKKADPPAIETTSETGDSRLVRKLKARLGMDDVENNASWVEEETATSVAPQQPLKKSGLMDVGKEREVKESRLISKLKAKLGAVDMERDAALTQETEAIPPPVSPQQRAARIERLLAKIDAEAETERRKPMVAPPQSETAANESKPRLLQRLQEEYNNSLNQAKA